MKPFMRNKVTAEVPILDENGHAVTDKYGRPKTKAQKSKARVQFRSKLVYDKDGREAKTNVEIDLPASFDVMEGTEIKYTTAAGSTGKGLVVSKEDIVNLTGDKVYYRTVFVNGR